MLTKLLTASVGSLALASAVPANAATVYVTSLSGAQETPLVASPAAGTAVAAIDDALSTLTLTLAFFNLRGSATGASLNCCTPLGSNTGIAINLTGFPTGTTAGGYFRVFNLLSSATYNAAFRTSHGGTAISSRNALIAGLDSGLAYLNVRSTPFPRGEIRGQLALVPTVPEPSEWLLMLAGSMLTGMMLRQQYGRRQRVRFVLA